MTNVDCAAVQLDRQVSGHEFSGLIGHTRPEAINRVGRPDAIDLHPINRRWTEAGVTAASQPQAGGDSLPGLRVPAPGQFMAVVMAVEVTAQVKIWVGKPATNLGWALAPATGAPSTVACFDSKKSTATGHVARLDPTPADQGPAGPANPRHVTRTDNVPAVRGWAIVIDRPSNTFVVGGSCGDIGLNGGPGMPRGETAHRTAPPRRRAAPCGKRMTCLRRRPDVSAAALLSYPLPAQLRACLAHHHRRHPRQARPRTDPA